MFKNIRANSARALALVSVTLMTAVAHAQTAGPLEASLDAVDLAGLAVKVGAIGLLIIGIAMAFKGPDLGKRVVRKV